MPFDIGLLPLAGFAALMVAAAIEDFRRLVIPNQLVLALCVLWLAHVAAMRSMTPAAALEALAYAVLAFGAGAILFARGLIGGGDVKLFTAATLWAGADRLTPLLVLTGLIGGVLALLFLTPLRLRLSAGEHAEPGPNGIPALVAGQTPIPYGVAIAAAALVVTIPPYFR